MAKAILATIPNTHRQDTLLEVALEQTSEGTPLVALRHLTWGEGLGWCPQQSLQLSPDEAEALLNSLRTTRQLWQDPRRSTPGKVIPFPTTATPNVQKKSQKVQSPWQQKKTGEAAETSPARKP